MSYILRLFDEKVKKIPSNVFLENEDIKYTFREIDEITDNLASIIKESYDENIGVYLKDATNVAIVYIAILKANKNILPLNPMVDLAVSLLAVNDVIDVSTVVVDQDLSKSDNIVNLINLNQLNKSSYAKISNYNREKSKSYIWMMTSGTTGQPKKMRMSEENLIWLMSAFENISKLNSTSRFLFSTPYTFDVSLTEIFAPVFYESTLVCLPKTNEVLIREFKGYIDKKKITHISLSPSYANGVFSECKDKDRLETLQFIGLAGEELDTQTAKMLKKKISDSCEMYNLYGPSECTIYATYHKVDEIINKVPIGKPLPGVKYIVKKDGELLISSPGCLNEYYKNDKLTKEKFISIGDDIYYKTGDFVTEHNSILTYEGRSDRQVQVNGIRVELDYYEELLEKSMMINKVKSVFYKDAVYLLIQKKEMVSETEIIKYVKRNIPNNIIPKLVLVESFLYTVNRKLDIKKMIKIGFRNKNLNTPTENQMYDILYDMFNTTHIELLNSLEKIKFLTECELFFGKEINDSVVFSDKPILRIAEIINENKIKINEKIKLDLKMKEINSFNEIAVPFLYYHKSYYLQKRHLILSTEIILPDSFKFKNFEKMLNDIVNSLEIFSFKITDKPTPMFWVGKEIRLIDHLKITHNKLQMESIQKYFDENFFDILWLINFESKSRKLHFYFSHFIMDAASIQRVTAIIYKIIYNEQITSTFFYSDYIKKTVKNSVNVAPIFYQPKTPIRYNNSLTILRRKNETIINSDACNIDIANNIINSIKLKEDESYILSCITNLNENTLNNNQWLGDTHITLMFYINKKTKKINSKYEKALLESYQLKNERESLYQNNITFTIDIALNNLGTHREVSGLIEELDTIAKNKYIYIFSDGNYQYIATKVDLFREAMEDNWSYCRSIK